MAVDVEVGPGVGEDVGDPVDVGCVDGVAVGDGDGVLLGVGSALFTETVLLEKYAYAAMEPNITTIRIAA